MSKFERAFIAIFPITQQGYWLKK